MRAYRDDDARAPRPIHYTTEWFVYKQTRIQTLIRTGSQAHAHEHHAHTGHNKRAFYDSQAYIWWHKIPFNSESRKNNDKAFAFSLYPITFRAVLALVVALSCSFPVRHLCSRELPEHYKTSDKIKVANDAFLQVLRSFSAISSLTTHIALFSFSEKISVCKNFATVSFWNITGSFVALRFVEHCTNTKCSRSQSRCCPRSLFHSDCIVSCPILSLSKCSAMNHFLRPNKKKSDTIFAPKISLNI